MLSDGGGLLKGSWRGLVVVGCGTWRRSGPGGGG